MQCNVVESGKNDIVFLDSGCCVDVLFFSRMNFQIISASSQLIIEYFFLLFHLIDLAHKRKIYDNRGSSHNIKTHHYSGGDTTSSSYRRERNRYPSTGSGGGYPFRGFFEQTPFYKFFGIDTDTHIYKVLSHFSTINLIIHTYSHKTFFFYWTAVCGQMAVLYFCSFFGF